MTYIIRYATRQGGSGMQYLSTNKEAELALIEKHRQRLKARVEKGGITIGECYKSDGRWQWYIDQDA